MCGHLPEVADRFLLLPRPRPPPRPRPALPRLRLSPRREYGSLSSSVGASDQSLSSSLCSDSVSEALDASELFP